MVSIITCTMRNECMENLFQNYKRQRWRPKELIIILNHDDMDIALWKKRAKSLKNVSIYQKPSHVTLGACLNKGVQLAKYDYIAKFDDDDYYGAYYLKDIMEAFKKTKADIVGKRTTFCYFENTGELLIRDPDKENKFVLGIKGPTIVFKKSIFKTVKFPHLNTREDSRFLRRCKKNGFKIYSTDKYNFTYCRRDFKQHTSLVSDQFIYRTGKYVTTTSDFRSIVDRKIEKG